MPGDGGGLFRALRKRRAYLTVFSEVQLLDTGGQFQSLTRAVSIKALRSRMYRNPRYSMITALRAKIEKRSPAEPPGS
ncbi:MAG: hypothetical protein M3454_08210, partial [Actinomycetota bacterium]|nr:hypothetical protein [Actinomycetota bacterium]